MDHRTQVELGRRILALKEAGEQQLAAEPVENPVSDFTSPRVFELERERFFRSGPILAGLSCDVAAPGEYLTLDAAGVPIAVTRGPDGQLHAFLNVCRHRGAQVLSGRGVCSGRFVCPYHGWSYDVTGRLAAWSSDEGFRGLDAASLGMTSLRVAEAFGLVYVLPAPGPAPDVERILEGAKHDLSSFDFASWCRIETRSFSRALNWKIVVDTFLEQYHLPVLHRASIAPFFHGTLCVYDELGCNGRLTAVRRTIGELEDKPEEQWDLLPHVTVLYTLFPNNVLIHQQDHVELWQVFPGDTPEESHMVVTLYAPEPADSDAASRHWKTNMDLLLDVTNTEDFEIGEKIQRGFHSAAQETIVFGRNEPGLIHFHRMLHEALREDPTCTSE